MLAKARLARDLLGRCCVRLARPSLALLAESGCARRLSGAALDAIIAAADQALYAAKAAGRNAIRAIHRLGGLAMPGNAGEAAPEPG